MIRISSSQFKLFKLFIPIFLVAIVLTGCSDDNGNPLAGDLSFQIEGTPGVSAFMAISHSQGLNFEGQTIGSREIPEEGFYSEDLEGGDFDAYQISASIADSDADFTLRLISDGDILDEASEENEDGLYLVKVGEFPDLEDLFE